jgi:hypothetical protein
MDKTIFNDHSKLVGLCLTLAKVPESPIHQQSAIPKTQAQMFSFYASSTSKNPLCEW